MLVVDVSTMNMTVSSKTARNKETTASALRQVIDRRQLNILALFILLVIRFVVLVSVVIVIGTCVIIIRSE
jgi:uncharacterized membrane protein